MRPVLRVLLVEDSQAEAALLLQELQRGYEVIAERVETPAAMAAVLDRATREQSAWHLILADNDLPGFSGIAALHLARARGLDLPLLIVSAREDEETALAAMRAGAHDYFVKGQFDRLLPAVERELREADQRLARRTAETALQHAYQHTADILENISDAFYAVDSNWRFTYINRQAEAMWGRRREELLGKMIWEEFPAAVGSRSYQEQLRAARERRAVEFETLSPISGRWIRVNAAPNSTGLSVYFRDLTERQQAEATLREIQATLQSFYDSAPLLMGVVELEGDDILHIYDNPAAERFLGVQPDALRDRRASRLGVPPEILQLWITQYRCSQRTGQPSHFEYQHPARSGPRWLSVTVAFIGLVAGDRPRFSYVAEDITERQAARELLRQSQRDLEAAQAVAHVGSWTSEIVAVDGGWQMDRLQWSAEASRIFGLSLDDRTCHVGTFLARVHPDDVAVVQAAAAAALEHGQPTDLQHRIIRPDGEVRWVHERAELVRDEHGRPVRLVGTTQDITERVESEARLRKGEDLLRRVVELLPVGVFVADQDGNITLTNSAARKIWEGERHVGLERYGEYKGWWADTGEPLTGDDWGMARAVRRGETSLEEVIDIECFDGTRKTIINSAVPIYGHNQAIQGGIAISADISERRRAEQEKAELLRQLQSQRAYLESVLNQMPSGVILAEAPSGRFIYHNEEAARIVRHPVFPTSGLREYVQFAGLHLDGRPYTTDEYPIARAIGQGAVVHQEVMRYRSGDGELIYLSVNAAPIRNEAGEIIGGVTTFHDITAQKNGEEALRQAREAAEAAAVRATSLQGVTAALSGAVTVEQVLDAIVHVGMPALETDAGMVALLSPDGEALEVLYGVGYTAEQMAENQRVPLSAANPLAEVARTRQPIWVASRAEFQAVYPHLAHAACGNALEAAVFLPLVVESRTLGVMALGFRGRHEFGADERNFMLTLAGQCVQALERARLYEAEQQAHRVLEERVRQRTGELESANERLAAEMAERQRVEQQLERAREEERTRIAREIHDELGGAMTAIKMDVAWLRKHLPDERQSPELLQRIDALLDLVGATAQSVRRIATQLRPAMLDDLGLVAALEWLAQDFQVRTGVKTAFVSNVESVDLPDDQASGLYRIAQEALTNVTRHAEAREAEVRLEREAAALRLQIRDDGRGLTPGDLARGGSSGLVGMRERARLMGGRLDIDGLPTGGTVVGVTLPDYGLRHPNADEERA